MAKDSASEQPDAELGGIPSGVPKAVVRRLSLYLRELQHLVRDGHVTTNSTELGKLLGVTNAQVRKDLAYFGQFGYPGVGYRCEELISAIKDIMGTNQVWAVAMVGVGNLGRALLGYRGFQQQGFLIQAAFDTDPDVIGTTIDGVEVFPLESLGSVIQEKQIKLVILAVPAASAQGVADVLVKAGIQGIMNFAPVTMKLPSQVSSVSIDLAIQLEQLSYSVVKKVD